MTCKHVLPQFFTPKPHSPTRSVRVLLFPEALSRKVIETII